MNFIVRLPQDNPRVKESAAYEVHQLKKCHLILSEILAPKKNNSKNPIDLMQSVFHSVSSFLTFIWSGDMYFPIAQPPKLQSLKFSCSNPHCKKFWTTRTQLGTDTNTVLYSIRFLLSSKTDLPSRYKWLLHFFQHSQHIVLMNSQKYLK